MTTQKNRELTLKRVKADQEKRASRKAPSNMKMAVNDKGILTITVDLNTINQEALELSGQGKSYLVASTRGNIRMKKEGFEHLVMGLNLYIPEDEYQVPEHLRQESAKVNATKPSPVTTSNFDPKMWEQFQQFLKMQEFMASQK